MATAFKQVKNGSKSTLASSIDSSVTSLSVITGQGLRFPLPGNSFWVTIWDKAIYPDPRDDPNGEIVLVTARSIDDFTIVRAQLSTTAIAHAAGSAVEVLLMDQHFADFQTSINNVEDTYTLGAASSTDNAIARFDGTTGKLVQDSQVTVDDNGGMMTTGGLGVGIGTPTLGVALEGDIVLTNSSTANSSGRTITFRTAVTPRSSIAGFRDSTGSGGNLRFNVSAAGGAPVEAMRILSTKLIGMNTSTPNAQLQVVGDVNWNTAGNVPLTSYITVLQASSTAVQVGLQILGTGAGDSSTINGRFTANGNGPANIMYKSRGASIGSSTTVVTNDIIGNYTFVAADGTSSGVEVARIRARVDGTVGTGNVPGALEFFTNPGSTDQATVGMVLHKDNSLAIGYGSTQQSALLSVNGSGYFAGNLGTIDPILDNHVTTKYYTEALVPGTHNLIVNPGFETGTGAPFASVNGSSINSSTVVARTGIRSCLVSFATNVADNGLRIWNGALLANKSYLASVWVYIPAATAPTVGVRLSVQSTGLLPSNNVATTYTQVTDNWVRLQAAFQTTTTTPVNIYVISNQSTAGQICYVDDVSLQDAGSGVVSVSDGQIWDATVFSSINIRDSANIVLNSGAGTKIGTSTTQKLAFFGSTPVVQQSSGTDLGAVLSNLGLRAASTTYTLTTSAPVIFAGSMRIGYNSTAITTTTALTTTSVPTQDVDATSGAISITPPATTTTGYIYTVTKVDASANAVTLVGTFDGQVNPTLALQWNKMQFISTNVSGTFRVISKV